jgi:hypothetical protein
VTGGRDGVPRSVPDNERSDHETEEADERNGEPGASENHQTGVEQAAENQRNDPPA